MVEGTKKRKKDVVFSSFSGSKKAGGGEEIRGAKRKRFKNNDDKKAGMMKRRKMLVAGYPYHVPSLGGRAKVRGTDTQNLLFVSQSHSSSNNKKMGSIYI